MLFLTTARYGPAVPRRAAAHRCVYRRSSGRLLVSDSTACQVAHPTRHNKNLSLLIEGPVVQVASVHAKIRRDGYRSQKTAGNGTGSGGAPPSSSPASPDQPEEGSLDSVGGGQ